MELNGWYKVTFKSPYEKYSRNMRLQSFIGKCENFFPSGLCAFGDDNGVMLLVMYNDIVQMKPLGSD